MLLSRLPGPLRRNFCVSAVIMNRLANEKSPYILQHKNNPVNWYPWGEEAFTKARELNRPIFLSVGYSTCHWCHVMEKESFESEVVAKILNDNFVSVKVDREERPDVDKLYMSFIQALNGGGGGWPMSVFLTPSLAPITGGTYFPPEDRYGQMGFKSILAFISEKWREDPAHIQKSADEVMKMLGKSAKTSPSDAPDPEVAAKSIFMRMKSSYDEEHGGFGDAPKFPKPVDLSFLLRYGLAHPESEDAKAAIDMVRGTLHAIYRGGIHDHVGKGFHRYSVDAGWHVPHFEKMAYDQGQLLSVFSDFALLTGDNLCRKAARDIVEYVDENLSHKDGGFWSAEDADSYAKEGDAHKSEGAFCVWEKKEIEETLAGEQVDGKPLSDIFCCYYGINENGNAPPYTDPHDELKNKNVLIMHNTHAEMCEILGIEAEKLETAIDLAKEKLRKVRASRPKPHLDSKMVCSWQGLLISGHARASIALKDPYVCRSRALAMRALRAVEFVKSNLVDENGDLIRAVYTTDGGEVDKGSPIGAFSDDYAFLIQGLIDVYEATLDESHLEWADQLQGKMDDKFWEGDRGYFVSETRVGVRLIEDQDGAEPCASSVGLSNVVRLSEYLDCSRLKLQADHIVSMAASRLSRVPYALSKTVEAYSHLEQGATQIVIVAESSEEFIPLVAVVRSFLIPNLSIVRIRPSIEGSWLLQRAEHLRELASAPSPTVFVCQGRACGLPVRTADELRTRLLELTHANTFRSDLPLSL